VGCWLKLFFDLMNRDLFPAFHCLRGIPEYGADESRLRTLDATRIPFGFRAFGVLF